MLTGVKAELDKVEKLQDAKYVRSKIIIPAFKSANYKGRFTAQEYAMLLVAAKKDSVTAKDFDEVIDKSRSHVIRAQAIRKLRDARLLRTKERGGRRYTLRLVPNAVTSHIMHQLDENGLLPAVLRD